MNFDFETQVDRSEIGNLKESITDPSLLQAGIPAMNAAEMDYLTAPSLIESVKRMADRGILGFTMQDEAYNRTVCRWMQAVRNWQIHPNWIVPALGTIFTVATAIRLTTREGEGVIVQTPVYYRYEQAATRLGRRTVHNRLKIHNGRYEMDFEDLEEKMSQPDNRLLVLCNPQNPIGCVWSRETLERVAALSARYQVTVLSDEIFAEQVYDKNRVTPYVDIPTGRPYAITVTSLGKAFNCTGVNHANVIIPDPDLRGRFIQQRNRDHYGSMGPMEYAAVMGAYSADGQQWLEAQRAYLECNAHEIRNFFAANMPQVTLYPIEGSTVCWSDWSCTGLAGEELEHWLVEQALVQAENGSVYAPECGAMLRLNFGCSHTVLHAALERMKQALEIQLKNRT